MKYALIYDVDGDIVVGDVLQVLLSSMWSVASNKLPGPRKMQWFFQAIYRSLQKAIW